MPCSCLRIEALNHNLERVAKAVEMLEKRRQPPAIED